MNNNNNKYQPKIDKLYTACGYIFSSLNSERTFVSRKVLTAIRNKASGAATNDKERVSIIVCNCSIATVATAAAREEV